MAANYILLQRIELNASASSVSFTNIPQSGYTDLKFVMSARQSTAAVAADVLVTFNGSTSSNSNRYLYGDSASAGSGSNGYTPSSNYIAIGVGNNATANTFGSVEMYIPNYLSSNNKSFSVDSVGESNATSSVFQFMLAGLWSSSAAINQITVTPASSQSFLQYSTFSLYGLAAVGTTPVIAPKASGGNITTDGTYWIHTFNTTGVFTPTTSLTCDYLVVAGGGSGGMGSSGGSYAGGGGAGGMRSTVTGTGGSGSLESPISVAAQAYTITVGAGGAAVTTAAVGGNSGTSSTFSTITSAGGGGGGSFSNAALSGGSGGGGGEAGGGAAGAASPSGQGFAGGAYAGDGYAGGGGGAASVGASTYPNPSNGGSGRATSITGTSVTYAAGGKGGIVGTTNGTTNTGGGGDGKAGSSGTSGAGGSGIVVIRYAIA